MKFLQAGAARRFLFLVMALSLVACSARKEPPKAKPPVPVTVAKAVLKTVPVQVRAIGNVEPYTMVAIKAQVNGQLARVHFSEGQDVRKGALLFTIDPRPFEAALRQAEANLARDKAQARNAEEQVRRYAGLLKDGIVTQEQYDNLKTTAEALAATLAADREAVENARIQLGYCSIRSPIDGRTGNLAVQAGNLVKANDNPVLVTINQINPIYASFAVPEREMVEIRNYLGKGRLKVEALVAGEEQRPEEGTITFLDNTVDPATGTIRLKGTFANRERRLWPGQFVNVQVTLTTRPNVVVVPARAVQTGQQGQYVFVVKEDGTAEQRQIVAGASLNGATVIEQGLKPEETVVTDGQMRLVPGAKVVVNQGTGNPGPGTGDRGSVTGQGGNHPVPAQGKQQ